MGFNMKDYRTDAEQTAAPKQDEFVIHYLSIYDLEPSKENYFAMSEIDDLADDIELNGLMHNLVVRQAGEDGKHRLISGHRRRLACLALVERGNMNFLRVPCKIEQTTNDLVAELKLITSNTTARELSDYEKTHSIVRTKEIYLALKEKGMKLPGRMRDNLAKMFDVSPAQIGRAEKIAKDLAPELQEGFRDGRIGVTAAYDLATMPKEEQAEAAQELKATGAVKQTVRRNHRKAYEEEKANAPCRFGGKCTNATNLASHVKNGEINGCVGCCGGCIKNATCEKRCKHFVEHEDPAVGGLDEELERIISSGQNNNPYRQKMHSFTFNNDKDRRGFLDTYEQWGVWFEEPRLHVRYYRCELPNGLQLIVEKQDDTVSRYSHGEYNTPHVRYHAVKMPWYARAKKKGDYMADPPADYTIESLGITEILTYMDSPKGTVPILNASALAEREKKEAAAKK